MRRLISFGSDFEAQAGYSRAVVDGEWVFVAGTTGFDYAAMTIAEGPAEQTRQTFRNIERALAEAGAGLADIVRVQILPAEPRRLAPHRASAGRNFRRDPPGRDGGVLRPRGRAHEDRNRGVPPTGQANRDEATPRATPSILPKSCDSIDAGSKQKGYGRQPGELRGQFYLQADTLAADLLQMQRASKPAVAP